MFDISDWDEDTIYKPAPKRTVRYNSSDWDEDIFYKSAPKRTVIQGTDKNTPKEPPNKKLKQPNLQSPVGQKKQTAGDGKYGETSHNAQGTDKNTPKEPPNKKLKQPNLQSPVGQKKQTAGDAKSGETSHNAQERMGSIMSERVIKEEKPSQSDPVLQLNAEGKTHTFQFRIRKGEINKVVCNASKTVFGALNENEEFENDDKKGKEIIIRRSKEQNHEAAVKTDFPSCLIEDDEILQINFYKNKNIASTNQETTADTDPKSLVTFYIRTRGMKKKTIMKSSVFLNNNIDYVCVFAHKGDTFEEALQHDGRFSDDIFDKVTCKLVDDENANHSINLPVDRCDGKKFQLKFNVKCKKPRAPVHSDKNDGESVKHSQQPKNTKQKTIQEKKTKGPDPSTDYSEYATPNTSGNSSGDSGNSFFTDIQSILQTVLKEVLKKQENPQVQELLQKEYDKGVVECFTEVNKVRRIMDLSDSVCVIVVEDSPRGTGFLLFDRFILTNAHVVKDFVNFPPEAPHTHKLSGTLTAVFNHEVLGSGTINLQAKSELIAYRYEKDEKLRCHDYALLELEAAPENCTELLTCYKHGPSPKSGGIYIVGHPDCGVKKMDLCFIIGIENQLQSINKHRSENVSCPYVSWQCWPNLYKNQITYNSCFFHGSSGSPVFDAHGYLIGMHSGGFYYKEGERTRSVIEFSYSMQPIVESIITQVKTRSDILKLLKNEKFKNIQENVDLGKIVDTYGANISVEEEQQIEVEKMEVN
ncbi:serine protease FAM111A isoform X2 [Siphateles boraxobius]|uniref:serine protease FAM111A isoform X2 n=1 Tax=Siphateles boraxobius TaxID=180520 RepID=UPI004063B5ED